MAFPGVKVDVTTGNLLPSISVADAVPALIVPGNLKGVYTLYSEGDLPSGAVGSSEVVSCISSFYAEVGGSTPLIYMEYGTAAETDVVKGVNQLMSLRPDVTLIGAIEPRATHKYEKGGLLCDWVIDSVTALKSVCEELQSRGCPVRVLLGSRLDTYSGDRDITWSPREAGNGYVGVVLGSSQAEYRDSDVGVALGRATKVSSSVKLGDGSLGPLSITDVYFGGASYDSVGRDRVESWHDKGFITFMRRPGLGGWYFGVDHMCSTDDYSILAHGRVIDKAQRIVIASYMPYVERPMNVNDDGSIDAADAESISKTLESQLRAQMGDDVSNVRVVVPVSQDLVNSKTLQVQVGVLPLGYATWISVTLGLISNL